jgi:NRPS condensation-like uncharacterized protein
MKNIADFLGNLEKQDIKVWVEGDRLRCNAPKGLLTPELRNELANHKSAIISYLQQKAQAFSENKLPAIYPVSRDQDLPLTWTQQRLWFLDRLASGNNNAYNLSTALELTGDLNITALEKTIAEIIKRHEIFRTTFQLINDTPVQIIHHDLTINLPIIDVHQESELEKLALAETSRRFDLANGPLLHGILFRRETQSYILLIVIHHIIFDGWSTGIFIKEFSTLYQTFALGLPSPLPKLPIQYADFAVWQRQALTEDFLKPQLDYWQQQLAGVSPLLKMPTDRPRPVVDSMKGDSETFQLNYQVTENLKNLSKRFNCTLYMVLLAALATLLFRYSDQEDLTIGSPIANRYPQETESLIGLIINTLVLRLDLSANPTFGELLKRVRQVTLSAYENQNVPLEKLVKDLNIKRDLSHNPLFQVWYTLQDTAVTDLELSGLQVRPLEFENPTAIFDLEFIFEYIPEGIKGRLRYKTDLFDKFTIVQLIQNFQTLLNNILVDPESRIGNIQILTDAETGGYSIHDFPDAELTQSEFEQLVREINKISIV